MSDLASLYIKVDSTGVVTASRDLEKLANGSKKAETATQSITKSFKEQIGIVKQLAVAYGLYKLAQQIKDVTLLAARYETLGVSMRSVGNNAGHTYKEMQKFQSALEKTGISMLQSRNNLIRMVQAQIDLKEATALGTIAQNAAVIGNTNSSEAFERVILGIQRGQKEILTTIGLNVDFEAAERKLEAQLGKTRNGLNAVELMQARVNAAKKAGVLIENTYAAAMGTAGKQLLSLQRHVENLRVAFGAAFTPALAEIVENITKAFIGLNEEISGDNAEKINDWGVKFRIGIISIEAEIMRLAMKLDKLGGTMTSAKMLLYGPGTALGIESSTKRFEAAAAANMEYERRYKETDKALEDLAAKQIRLEHSLTAEGKAAAKAAGDIAEKKRIEAAKFVKAEADKAEAVAKTVAVVNKANEDINRIVSDNVYKLQAIGKTQYQQDLIEIQKNVKAYRDAGASKVAISKYTASETTIANAEESYRQAEEARRIAEKGVKEVDPDEYLNKLAEAASYYDGLIGFEDTYHEKMLELIEARRTADIEAKKDVAAANAKAVKARNDLAEESYNLEINHIKKQWGGYSDMFEGLGQLYADDSGKRKRLHDIAMAFQLAEQAQLLITAVRAAVVAVATQGAGDPYTAFARVAAMAGLMAATLAKAGISFGGGGSASAPSAKSQSTVLGAEAGTGSESISKSWELLQDTYDMEYHELSGIHAEMRDLNNNITGLVTSIIRTGGVGDMGISTGYEKGLGDIVSSLTTKTIQIAETADAALLAYAAIAPGLALTTAGLAVGVGILADYLTGGWVSKQIGSLVGKVFGGGTETSVTGSGIVTGSGAVGALAGGGGISSRQYADIRKRTEGGWFKKDSEDRYTKYQALDESVQRLITKVFQGMSETLITLTLAFGTDMDKTLNYVFAGAKLNLKGMSSEQINKTLSEYFSALGDKAVDTLFGSILRTYQQVGEGLLETAQRILIDKAVVVDTLKMTGQAFTGTIPEVIAFSEAIIKMSGDLETFRKNAEAYYDKFFSEEEKQARLQTQLTDVLTSYNLLLPLTREGYRAIVESLDLTTTAGQEAYATLLALAKNADSYYSSLEQAQEKQIAKQKELIASYQSVTDAIRAAIDEIRGTTTATTATGFKTLFAAAMGGDMTSLAALPNAAKAYLAAAEAANGTYIDYRRLEAQVLLMLQRAANFSEGQKNILTSSLVPGHATGLERVPYDGYLMEAHKDEAVLTAPQAARWRGENTGNVVGLDEFRELKRELEKLRLSVEAGNNQIARNTGKTSKILTRFDDEGLPAERTA